MVHIKYSTTGMVDDATCSKKELARIKMAERNRLPHRMEYHRNASIARSKAHKVETTAKRLDEHTMDELVNIARQKCEARNIDFTKYQDSILTVLRILHNDGHVFSEGVCKLYTPTSSSESSNDPSQKDDDRVHESDPEPEARR